MIVLPSAKYFSSVPSVAEIARFKTNRNTGTFGGLNSFGCLTSTGYLAVKWWDGVTTIYGTGNSAVTFYVTKSVVAPYNTTAEKDFSIYACNSSGQIIGHISSITFTSSSRSPITFIDHYSLSKLDVFTCNAGSNLTSYKHNGRITFLSITDSGLTSIDLSNGFRLENLVLTQNSSLSSITGVSSLRSMYSISANSTAITSLDLSGLPALFNIDLRSAPITSLRAVGLTLFSDSYSTASFFTGGAKLMSTSLSGAALDQFYTDLSASDGTINVTSSTGAASDTPSIATSKGYIVIGS
jgi:hypothetical protein